MTERDPGPRWTEVAAPEASARAVIDTAALERNIAVARRLPGAPDAVDARADGWGHGAAIVAAAALRAGVRDVVVEVDRLGIAVPEGIRLHSDRRATLDAATVFGLPGAATATTAVMTLTGTVLSTKPLRAGEGVSYGYTHRAAADTVVALVTGGYAQGVPRAVGNLVDVRIGNGSHRIIGRVAMDVCVVDVGRAVEPVRAGDRAVFFGDPAAGDPALARWCERTGLSAGEIVALTGRARREER